MKEAIFLSPRKTCITYHEKFIQYNLGVNHPYRGDRFIKAMEYFEKKDLFNAPNISLIKPEPIKKETLLKAHNKEYVDYIFRLAELNEPYDIETPTSKSILEAVMYIIGGVIRTGEAVYSGEFERAVALGGGYHHAGRNYGGGFRLFNDIAVLIEYLRERFDIKRFLVLDYDVHSGNGTSDIYYTDLTVLFISIHQDPTTIYPGSGFIDEVGAKEGAGYNVNIPLPMRTGEEAYLYALKEIFPPLAKEFKPEIIIANGGSDAHFADHLGSLGLTAKSFLKIARLISQISDSVCKGKALLLVGSGYNIQVLPYCWYALVAGIAELNVNEDNIEDYYPAPSNPWQNIEKVEKVIDRLKSVLRKYWSCFE
ncbi:MAG: histone deacetylase [Candidatus Bathyarchaeia archaeon]